MNAEFIISMTLTSVILFLVVITILFFIEHKKEKVRVSTSSARNRVKGYYLARYVPESLELKYSTLSTPVEDTEDRYVSKLWYLFLGLASVILIMVFVAVSKTVLEYIINGFTPL